MPALGASMIVHTLKEGELETDIRRCDFIGHNHF